jgi:hypothetical protein
MLTLALPLLGVFAQIGISQGADGRYHRRISDPSGAIIAGRVRQRARRGSGRRLEDVDTGLDHGLCDADITHLLNGYLN